MRGSRCSEKIGKQAKGQRGKAEQGGEQKSGKRAGSCDVSDALFQRVRLCAVAMRPSHQAVMGAPSWCSCSCGAAAELLGCLGATLVEAPSILLLPLPPIQHAVVDHVPQVLHCQLVGLVVRGCKAGQGGAGPSGRHPGATACRSRAPAPAPAAAAPVKGQCRTPLAYSGQQTRHEATSIGSTSWCPALHHPRQQPRAGAARHSRQSGRGEGGRQAHPGWPPWRWTLAPPAAPPPAPPAAPQTP